MLSGFIRLADRLSAWAALLAYALMLAMVAIGTFNTLARWTGRYLQHELASNAYIELQWYFFGAIFLLAGAETLRRDAHVRVDVLYDRLSVRARAYVNLSGLALFVVPFCVFMLVVSWGKVAESWRIGEMSPDPDGLPRPWIKSVIPLAFALLLLQALAAIVRQADALRPGPAPVIGPRTDSAESQEHL